MIMTMLLPAAAGAVEGDERGGDTNVMEQFALVLTHPFAYIKIFLRMFGVVLTHIYLEARVWDFWHMAKCTLGLHFWEFLVLGLHLPKKRKSWF